MVGTEGGACGVATGNAGFAGDRVIAMMSGRLPISSWSESVVDTEGGACGVAAGDAGLAGDLE